MRRIYEVPEHCYYCLCCWCCCCHCCLLEPLVSVLKPRDNFQNGCLGREVGGGHERRLFLRAAARVGSPIPLGRNGIRCVHFEHNGNGRQDIIISNETDGIRDQLLTNGPHMGMNKFGWQAANSGPGNCVGANSRPTDWWPIVSWLPNNLRHA